MAEFKDLVAVYRNLTNVEPTPYGSTGKFIITTQAQLEALVECEKESEKTAIYISDPIDLNDLKIGCTAEIETRTPKLSLGILAENLDSLLTSPKAHVKEPRNYYIQSINYLKGEPSNDASLKNYQLLLGFIAMLKSCAAFLDETEEVLVFIKGGKFEVPVKYTTADFQHIDQDTLKALIALIPENTHEKQCKTIMNEAIHELTAGIAINKRFAYLLEHAKELKIKFDKGYELFTAGFSYEKIRDEIEAARVEYSGKIHKVFSDIQNQLLGIPVSTIIVATQMKASKTSSEPEFLVSTAVFFGSLIFAIIIIFLLRNQKQTLEVIGIEIGRQKVKLEKEHAAIAKNFKDTFESLSKRQCSQKWILRFIDFIVVLGVILSCYFYYKLSLSVQPYVNSILAGIYNLV